MTNENMDPPPGWGSDNLTRYLDNFRENQFATFYHCGDSVNNLIRIDKAFHKLLEGARNLRPSYPAFFMLRAHSAFKCASSGAMAGQCYEIHTLLRLSLEQAGYGLYIGANQDRFETWLRRHDDDHSLKNMKREFLIKNISKHINSLAPTVAEHFQLLYEQTIDFGAHPNERGFSSNLEINRDSEFTEFQVIYLHNDHNHIKMALINTAQVGLWLLIATQLIWKERFELLGLRQEVELLKSMVSLP